MRNLLFFLIGMAICTACTTGPAAPAPDSVSTVVASTLTAVAQGATATGADAPTATLSQQLAIVETTAQNVNLRTGPGTIFKVSRVMPVGTRLEILGLARGAEWLWVRNVEGIRGWVDGRLVSDWRQYGLDIVDPTGVQVVAGRVQDEAGKPLMSVGFAVYPAGGGALRTDAISGADGMFYAYLPPEAVGTWTVEYVSIGCPSAVMDANCECLDPASCGPPDPVAVNIALPLKDTLIFVWR